MKKTNLTAIFFLVYLGLRIFTYFFSPETPLYTGSIINTAVSLLILCSTIYFLIKKETVGWLIVAGEIILGGSGGFLAIFSLSLRTCLLLVSLTIFFIKTNNPFAHFLSLFSSIVHRPSSMVIFFPLITITTYSLLHGYILHNTTSLIISDFIPYLFLFYIFPLKKLWHNEQFKNISYKMLQVAIISNLFFVLFTFIIFSGNWVYLQGDYYHWFRDVALGKITDMGNNFYRVVLNEHLLLIPILLSGIYQTIKTSSKKITWFFVLPLLVILSLNLTRIYFLAMIIGLLFLFTKNNWKKWIIYSVAACLTIFISFTILHLSASRGQSLGWEFFGIRIQSITQPTIEDSSLSRMLILPQAIAKINNRPLLGNGIGDEITVYSPILKQQITTSQFDWGWLEIIAEMGILGLLAWLYFIVKIFLRKPPQHLTAGLISLLIINLTSPALFHVFGIIFLILLV